jgi:hypothetical protein
MSVCLLGLEGSLLGLFCLLFGPSKTNNHRSLLSSGLALVVALLAGGAAVGGLPQPYWLPPLGLAIAWGFFQIIRLPLLGRVVSGAWRTLCNRRVQAALLLAGGGGLIAWQSFRLEANLQAEMVQDIPQLELDEKKVALEEVTTQAVFTDHGRPVPVFTVAAADAQRIAALDEGKVLARYRDLTLRVLRVKALASDCNCHGWTFCGGRYWVRGKDIEPILQDNNYREVSLPQAGDLIVFRDAQGQITHTGQVCGFARDGQVLIESKWGQLGLYVHTATDHVYHDSSFKFYRSPRGGHLLHGLDDGSPNYKEMPSGDGAIRLPAGGGLAEE